MCLPFRSSKLAVAFMVLNSLQTDCPQSPQLWKWQLRPLGFCSQSRMCSPQWKGLGTSTRKVGAAWESLLFQPLHPGKAGRLGDGGSLLRLWASGQGGKQDPPHMGAASAKQAHLGHARQVGGLVRNQVPASPMLPALSPSGTQGPAPLWCVQPADTHVTLLHSWPFCCWTDLPCSDSPPRGHQPSLAPGPAPPPPGQQPSSSFLPAPRPRLPSP